MSNDPLNNTKNMKELKKENITTNSLDTIKIPPPKISFCYATHLPAGYHHFLIYDPSTDRVFIKDIIVPMSSYS